MELDFIEGEQVGLILVPEKGFNEIELPAFSNFDLHLTVDVNLGGKGQISYSGRNLKKNNISLDGLLFKRHSQVFNIKSRAMMKKIVIIILIPFLILNCEENPFSSKSQYSSSRLLKDWLRLKELTFTQMEISSNVFVWMKELGITANSGADGSFELGLPAASTPTGGGIADGDYLIYFYMSNYQISSIKVTFAFGWRNS